ncbi:MAG: hypothetical protein DMF64_18260 [Acidobacteria bacterium]|nr:MAG: hypothetical protein DMF64_18260 [Acidobacteriota bacterium]
MRFKTAYFGLFALAALIAAPPALEHLSARTGADAIKLSGFVAHAQDRRHDDDDWPERDTFDQNYQLAPGASVRVSGINGTVTIETANTQTAEVHVVRTARTRSDLEYHRVLVEQTASGLYIHGESEHNSDEWRNREVRQRVTLRLPRQIELQASGINGRTTVGEVDGPVRLSGINGKVDVAQARGYSDISGINGTLTITITQLGERGVHVSGVNGGVELRFAEALNADLHVTGINGSVYTDVPNVVVQGRVNRSNFNAQIGTGGAPINISGINGHVRLAPRS